MSEFDVLQAADAYPEGIENGFWTLARNRLLDTTLGKPAALRTGQGSRRILEVGCGPGVVVGAMRDAGHDIWGVELGTPTVRDAAAPFVTTGTRAEDLDRAFRDSVDTLMLLDVIEHIENDVAFLQSLLPAFPNCRCVIVTVPARQEVWSNYDEYYGHYRRYTIETLNRSLVSAGLRPVKTRYFFQSLYLAALLINFLGQKRQVVLSPPRSVFLHRVIAKVLDVENRVFNRLPGPGLSLLSIAEIESPTP